MKNKNVPKSIEENSIFETAEYLRISKAAELLKLTSLDLLHMGAIGKVAITAPVVSEGIFEWPCGSAGIPFPEIEDSFKYTFNATNRVILAKKDILNIEAIGWTIPDKFFDPKRAREAIEYIRDFVSEPPNLKLERVDEIVVDGEIIGYCELPYKTLQEAFEEIYYSPIKDINYLESEIIQNLKPWISDINLVRLREYSFHTYWCAVKSINPNSARTTIDHLSISKKELLRLINVNQLADTDTDLIDNKQIEIKTIDKVHGNTEINATKRESILKAAICCKERWPEDCMGSTAWAETIYQNASHFWPETNEPPQTRDQIARLLGKALKLPELKSKNTPR